MKYGSYTKGPTKIQDIYPHVRAAHVRLKNEFMEDEKCHNLMSWLIYGVMEKREIRFCLTVDLHVHVRVLLHIFFARLNVHCICCYTLCLSCLSKFEHFRVFISVQSCLLDII